MICTGESHKPSPGKSPTIKLQIIPHKEIAPANSSITIRRSRTLRILLAEDDVVNLIAEKRMLEKAGHTVTTAMDGQEVLDRVAEQNFDLILMDVKMPVIDGVVATRAIREGMTGHDRKCLPIIAVTAYTLAGDKEKFLSAGMNGYISKPVSIIELHTAIENVMSKHDEL